MTLAKPEVIETLSYEAIFAVRETRFKTLWAALRVQYPSLPEYDVSMLETDPAKILLQEASYNDLIMRARINDVGVRANLIAYASNADLDNLAAFYGITRLLGEGDIGFRSRIELGITGRSTAGPEERYAFVARSASVRVRDVKIYKVSGGPALQAAVLSTDNNGIPDAGLLASVTSALNSPSVLCLNDNITAVAAVKTTVNIVVAIELLPDAPFSIIGSIEALLRSAWDAEAGIGFDLTTSWLASKIHVAGVYSVAVTSPSSRVVAGYNEAIALGTIAVTLAGRNR